MGECFFIRCLEVGIGGRFFFDSIGSRTINCGYWGLINMFEGREVFYNFVLRRGVKVGV